MNICLSFKSKYKQGYVPLTNLTIKNLQTRKANFKQSVNYINIGSGLLLYFLKAGDANEVKKRILLLSSYLFVHTKRCFMFDYLNQTVFKTLNVTDENILSFFLDSILKSAKNPKVQNLIYLLATTKDKYIVKYMLEDKKTKELFKKALDYYKRIKKC